MAKENDDPRAEGGLLLPAKVDDDEVGRSARAGAQQPVKIGLWRAATTLQRELDVAIAAKQPLFELPAGDVQFPHPAPGFYTGSGAEALLIRGARDLIIRGTANTTLLFALGGGLRLHGCRNVTLEAVAIDYAPLLPYAQARIASIMVKFTGLAQNSQVDPAV